MFCSKCGGKIVEYTEFCSECGNKINNDIIKKSSNASSGQSKKHSLFNKKTIINSVIFLTIAIGVFILYSTLYGFNKLSWDKNYGDNDLEIVTQTM